MDYLVFWVDVALTIGLYLLTHLVLKNKKKIKKLEEGIK